MASPWSKTYHEPNHTLRKFRDGESAWPSFEAMIFDADHSHRCPTYVHRTPPCQGSCPAGEDIRGWLQIARGLVVPFLATTPGLNAVNEADNHVIGRGSVGIAHSVFLVVGPGKTKTRSGVCRVCRITASRSEFQCPFDFHGRPVGQIREHAAGEIAVGRLFQRPVPGQLAGALLLGGGLSALQGAAVSTGIPFTLVVLTMCYCVYVALRTEPR